MMDNFQFSINFQKSMEQFSNKYNLEERTAKFGEAAIKFSRTIKQDSITKPIISQLVRSSTSIGANYMEANGASSKKDFKNKIFICEKEAQESKHWLRMMASCSPEKQAEARELWQECQELTLIFQKITSTLRGD